MKKLSLILLILSISLIVGCSSNEPSSTIGGCWGTGCNADTVGTQVSDDCNTCTCTEMQDGTYGWACTEIGCNAFS